MRQVADIRAEEVDVHFSGVGVATLKRKSFACQEDIAATWHRTFPRVVGRESQLRQVVHGVSHSHGTSLSPHSG